MKEKLLLNRNMLTKKNEKGDIIWEVDTEDPDWYSKVANIEGTKKLLYDLETSTFKTYKWGNYLFNFACGKDNTLLEVSMAHPNVKYIPDIPALRPGLILEDEDRRLWEVAYMEPFSYPPSKLKGAGRFEPSEGIYSPYGWYGFRYHLKAK